MFPFDLCPERAGCLSHWVSVWPSPGPPSTSPKAPAASRLRRCAGPGPRGWAAERAAGCLPGPPSAALTCVLRSLPDLSICSGPLPRALPKLALPLPSCTATPHPPIAQNTWTGTGLLESPTCPCAWLSQHLWKGCHWLNKWVSALS